MKIIKTKTAEMFVDDKDILRIIVKEGAEMDLKAAIENFEAALELSGGRRMMKLVDARHYFSMTPEARKFAGKMETKQYNIARAIVTKTLANRLLINFFIKFNKPTSPFKLFIKEDEAIQWLFMQKQKEEEK